MFALFDGNIWIYYMLFKLLVNMDIDNKFEQNVFIRKRSDNDL